MRKNKKAQMEIMGLAIVVVLLMVGLMFALRFTLFKAPQTYRKEYSETQLAANMLNTLLNTNTECNDISIGELLSDASKDNPSITCPGSPSDSQGYATQTINNLTETILNISLVKDYYLKASVPGKVVVEAGKERTVRERERKTQFLQTDAGVMTITLDIYG
ncbi:hypothetical protein CEE44_02515 [Candidatus Woesearchaeota archaeon B3_Woes]|nr:MAG: hypothetical protein CEE44_02515 [Candidatus Woesearchaeota archaeon B3_Woes]